MNKNLFDTIEDPSDKGALLKARMLMTVTVGNIAYTYFRQKAKDVLSGNTKSKQMDYVSGKTPDDWKVMTHPTFKPVLSPSLMASVIIYGLAKVSYLKDHMLDGKGRLYPSVLLDSVFSVSSNSGGRIRSLALARMNILGNKAAAVMADPSQLVSNIDSEWFHGLVKEWHTRGMKSTLCPVEADRPLYQYAQRTSSGLMLVVSYMVQIVMKAFLNPDMLTSGPGLGACSTCINRLVALTSSREDNRGVFIDEVASLRALLAPYTREHTLDSETIGMWKEILDGEETRQLEETTCAGEDGAVDNGSVKADAEATEDGRYDAMINSALACDEADLGAIGKLRDACTRRIMSIAPEELKRKRAEYEAAKAVADGLLAQIRELEALVGKEVSNA